MIESKTTGLKEVLERIDALSETPHISSSAVADGYHEGGVANATIANAQRKQGRDPGFLDPSDDNKGMGLVREMADAWTDGKAEAVYGKAQELGALFVAAVKRNVQEGRSVDGPMAPLSKRYEFIKRFTFHAGDKPILVRSGQLLASIVSKVTVRMRGR